MNTESSILQGLLGEALQKGEIRWISSGSIVDETVFPPSKQKKMDCLSFFLGKTKKNVDQTPKNIAL